MLPRMCVPTRRTRTPRTPREEQQGSQPRGSPRGTGAAAALRHAVVASRAAGGMRGWLLLPASACGRRYGCASACGRSSVCGDAGSARTCRGRRWSHVPRLARAWRRCARSCACLSAHERVCSHAHARRAREARTRAPSAAAPRACWSTASRSASELAQQQRADRSDLPSMPRGRDDDHRMRLQWRRRASAPTASPG